MYFASLASSSDGNAYVLYNEPDKLVLIDAGISYTRIRNSLSSLNLSIDHVRHVLITHTHHDHIYGIDTMMRRHEPNIIVHGANAWFFKNKGMDCVTYKHASSFRLFDMRIMPFEASHDVHTSSFIIESYGKKLSFLSDTGTIHEFAYDLLFDSHMLAIESNYSDTYLPLSDYPAMLQDRIKSHRGHLSNMQAQNIINTVYSINLKNTLLIHVSKRTNSPQIIREETLEYLEQSHPDTRFIIAPYDSPSEIFEI